MKRNALISLAGSLVVANFAFAQENSKIGLDVLAGAGYTHYNGVKVSDFKDDLNYNGFNVNASALYSVYKTEIGSPVVGLGINYNQIYSNTIEDSDDFSSTSYKQNFKTLALMGNLGYKFTLAPKFAIFALANLGYGVYNDVDPTFTQKSKLTGAVLSDKAYDVTVKDHFIYGVSLVGTYEVVENFSLGLGATYNRHQAKFEYKNKAESSSDNSSFNEFSTNLIASYSF
ncbi:outer membrane beta-barrel protein [Pigmentibacter ruber]|uniref:outer membrane beta-barrel protein n=1 Tax=Pigmentibacter ruber TaxID=2683196 RepID=UPI00131E87C9|nr:outer membrane beta-barrel protein [Pigmentibacter ruber]